LYVPIYGYTILSERGNNLKQAGKKMRIRRLKVDPKDPTLVMTEQVRGRGYKTVVAQTFGTKAFRQNNAALIVKSVNCHNHLIIAMQTVLRATQMPIKNGNGHGNGNGIEKKLRTRLALISRYATAALSKAQS